MIVFVRTLSRTVFVLQPREMVVKRPRSWSNPSAIAGTPTQHNLGGEGGRHPRYRDGAPRPRNVRNASRVVSIFAWNKAAILCLSLLSFELSTAVPTFQQQPLHRRSRRYFVVRRSVLLADLSPPLSALALAEELHVKQSTLSSSTFDVLIATFRTQREQARQDVGREKQFASFFFTLFHRISGSFISCPTHYKIACTRKCACLLRSRRVSHRTTPSLQCSPPHTSNDHRSSSKSTEGR